MGFWSSLSHSRDKPKNATQGSGYRFFLGATTSGKAATERSAMQMTAVYSCVRILDESDGTAKCKAVDHPLYRVLHDEPNREMTSFMFRKTLMTHLLL